MYDANVPDMSKQNAKSLFMSRLLDHYQNARGWMEQLEQTPNIGGRFTIWVKLNA